MSEPPDLITLLTEQHRDVDLLFYVRAPRPRGRRWPARPRSIDRLRDAASGRGH
ncbi:MAG: hypothetical protein ACRDQI_14260 [Pseudonocardiaceae bacterium]